jgi:hypothetical protein
MYWYRPGQTPADIVGAAPGYGLAACLVTAIGVVATFGLGMALTTGSARPNRPPGAAAPPAPLDATRFILNALLMPALDGDAVPLRWVDPRPVLHCGPNTAVRVNRGPLVVGDRVPDMPFELEWLADGCRPFGTHGPRFDGRVKLTVFREDWGFSAMVEPLPLRITSAGNVTTCSEPGAAWVPQTVNLDESFEPTVDNANRSLRCR